MQDRLLAALQVHIEQEKAYGKRKQFSVNVPTRWATSFFVLKDLVASEQSLKLAVCTPEWGQLGMGNYSDTFRTATLDEDTWECMKRLLELLKPFSDAIHQLEADKPMLSQCHLVIQQLREHVSAWSEKHRTSVGRSVCTIASRAIATSERRLESDSGMKLAPVNTPAYTAAYMLDPFYAVYHIQYMTSSSSV
jgi:hypothetical protein